MSIGGGLSVSVLGSADEPATRCHPVRERLGKIRTRLRSPATRHARQAHGRDDGGRAGRVRLRRRRPARHLLHQRRRPPIARQAVAGRLESPVPQRRQLSLLRCDGARRSRRHRVHDRCGRRRLRQRRASGPFRRGRAAQPAAAQHGPRNLRRCHGRRRHQELHLVGRRRMVRLRQRRTPRSVRRELRGLDARGQQVLRRPVARHPRLLSSEALPRSGQRAVPQPRRRHVRRRVSEIRHRRSDWQGHERRVRGL